MAKHGRLEKSSNSKLVDSEAWFTSVSKNGDDRFCNMQDSLYNISVNTWEAYMVGCIFTVCNICFNTRETIDTPFVSISCALPSTLLIILVGSLDKRIVEKTGNSLGKDLNTKNQPCYTLRPVHSK